MKRLSLMFVGIMALSGCSTGMHGGLYHWSGYSKNLYAFENNELTEQEYLNTLTDGISPDKGDNLEQAINFAMLSGHLDSLVNIQEGVRVPPGYYAEIGTAYLKLGDVDNAILYYEKEHDRWPESKFFMSTLLKGLKKNRAAFKGNSQ